MVWFNVLSARDSPDTRLVVKVLCPFPNQAVHVIHTPVVIGFGPHALMAWWQIWYTSLKWFGYTLFLAAIDASG